MSDSSTNIGKAIEPCPTIIIEDFPANEDSFATDGKLGPHQRVANAIAGIILSSKEVGGKMIALEGGWGSGKTTVINLLRKELSINSSIAFICFDAWAHQGDPLRRIYLESLINHFIDINWIDKKEWTKVLERLAKRRRVSSTTTTPRTTLLAKFLAISALIVPIGLPFLSNAINSGLTIDPKLPIVWNFFIGIFLASSPILVLILNGLRILFRNIFQIKRQNKDIPDFSFLVGHTQTKTRQETFESPDPTSIEFEQVFNRLLNTSLSKGRSVVIVIDNLDRLAACRA